MSNKSGAARQAKEILKDEGEKLGSRAEEVQKTISNNVSNIADKVQQGADSGKELLASGSEKARELVQQATNKAGDLKEQANQAISDASDYVKNIDLQDGKEAIESTVRENPGVLLITVGILGLAVGYMIGKRTV